MNTFLSSRSKLTKAVFFIVAIIFWPISLGIYSILKVRKNNWDETVKSLAILFLAVIFFFLSSVWVSAMFSSDNNNSSKIKGEKEEKISEKKKAPTPTSTPKPKSSPSPSSSPFLKPSPSPSKPSPSPSPEQEIIVEDKTEESTQGYKCDCSKTCPNISTCEEAYYQLNNCGCNIRDGDKDGVPCENICPGGKNNAQDTPSVSEPPTSSQPDNEGGGYTCNCSKTCPKMSSCAEAYFQLNNCGCSRRDGNNDGIPCESICK